MKDTSLKLTAVKLDPESPAMLLTEADARAYSELAAKYMADLQPRGAIEVRLVRSIVRTAWRLNRMESIADSMAAMKSETKHIEMAARQEERLTKMLLQLTKQLERTQAARRKRQISEAMDRPDQSPLVH